ncbi:heterochromatin protein 1-binding protein 3 isoform X1 [Pungitius pungitius]|uniref:heterochromatin protein 1-binding protein 3 isoform X1 n=1 Tax=Pungitius pungitius TaxID=134920 RepID=UPI002E131DD3
MPIRRVAATPAPEKAPSAAAEKEPQASSAESPAAAAAAAGAAEEEPAAQSAVPKEAEPTENGEKADAPAEEKAEEKPDKKEDKCRDCAAGQCATHCYVLLLRLKDGYKSAKAKGKKVKRTIPAWATLAAGKRLPVATFAGNNRVDSVLIEAITSSNDKSGVSYQGFMKYIQKKYPEMELDNKKFLIKKAMKKHLEKGTIKQLTGKGLSGTFAIGKISASPKKAAVNVEALGDALPLIITRLCEPKEASYCLIKKYLEQHFPNLNIQNRPDILKSALVKAVEKGHLEQITGKGANGTFQLKRAGNQVLLKGSSLEDAITAAITAMNEPKTCSTTTLRKYLVDANKDTKEYRLVASLRRTLTKCKVLGWMEQITGHGFTGTYQLSFPFYPSPTILYPDKFNDQAKKNPPARGRRTVHSSSEEEEEEEEEESESEDEAPSRKRKSPKRPPPKVKRPPAAKKSRSSSKSKAKGRGRSLAKKTPVKKTPVKTSPVKKAASSAKREGRKPSAVAKDPTPPPKAAPAKKAPAAKRPRAPAARKPTKRGAKRPASRESSPEEAVVAKETTTSGSKRSKTEDSRPERPAGGKAAAKGGARRSAPAKTTPLKAAVKKEAGRKTSARRSKRGKY